MLCWVLYKYELEEKPCIKKLTVQDLDHANAYMGDKFMHAIFPFELNVITVEYNIAYMHKCVIFGFNKDKTDQIDIEHSKPHSCAEDHIDPPLLHAYPYVEFSSS